MLKLLLLLAGLILTLESFAEDPFNDFSPKFKSSLALSDDKKNTEKHPNEGRNQGQNHATQNDEPNNCKGLMEQNSMLVMQNQQLINQNIALQQRIQWMFGQSHSPFLQVQPQPQFGQQQFQQIQQPQQW